MHMGVEDRQLADRSADLIGDNRKRRRCNYGRDG